MRKIAPTDLYTELREDGLVGAVGSIKMELLNIDVTINDKSSIGNLIQEWLGSWMKSKSIYFRTNHNTQDFPDFYLSENDQEKLLEVKAFDHSKSPNFDIANFDAYVRSVRTNSYRLNADYLIFGYTLTEGVLKIENVWLKKVWEISCPSDRFAIKTQVKQNKIYNIRPSNFVSEHNKYKCFGSRQEFVTALKMTLDKYVNQSYGKEWMESVATNYKASLAEEL